MANIRVITFYLTQYCSIPENYEGWGKGFTINRGQSNMGYHKAQKLYNEYYSYSCFFLFPTYIKGVDVTSSIC